MSVAYLSAAKVMQGRFGSKWQPWHSEVHLVHFLSSHEWESVILHVGRFFSHLVQEHDSTHSSPLLPPFSSHSLSPCHHCSPSDKDLSSFYLLSQSDKLEISHHCWERFPSCLRPEALSLWNMGCLQLARLTSIFTFCSFLNLHLNVLPVVKSGNIPEAVEWIYMINRLNSRLHGDAKYKICPRKHIKRITSNCSLQSRSPYNNKSESKIMDT